MRCTNSSYFCVLYAQMVVPCLPPHSRHIFVTFLPVVAFPQRKHTHTHTKALILMIPILISNLSWLKLAITDCALRSSFIVSSHMLQMPKKTRENDKHFCSVENQNVDARKLDVGRKFMFTPTSTFTCRLPCHLFISFCWLIKLNCWQNQVLHCVFSLSYFSGCILHNSPILLAGVYHFTSLVYYHLSFAELSYFFQLEE